MILPTAYFPPVYYFALAVQGDFFRIEAQEHFVKQTYRNRCEIYGANGKLTLTVPLKKWKNHTPVKDIKISFEDNWQILHWRSIESAYRTSPYFEFYEEDIKPLFFDRTGFLLERNKLLTEEIASLINCDLETDFTEKYIPENPDYRKKISPKYNFKEEEVTFKKYMQVFEDKHGFIPNLSILDLVFNLGPDSKTYLQHLIISQQ